MKRPRRRRLSIEVSGVVLQHLRELVATGMHGFTIEQCAEEMLREQLRAVLLAQKEAEREDDELVDKTPLLPRKP